MKVPHPAIFKINPIFHECSVCGEHCAVCFFDRELEDHFCARCLPFVELADRELIKEFERPVAKEMKESD